MKAGQMVSAARTLALALATGIAIVALSQPTPAASAAVQEVSVGIAGPPFYAGIADTASLARQIGTHLDRARTAKAKLLGAGGRRTVENTLRPYDDILVELNGATGLTNIVRTLHPDAAMRAAADTLAQDVSAFATDLGVDRAVLEALEGVDTSKADDDARHFLARELESFRREGVDRDPGVREQLKRLRAELVASTQAFDRNFRQGVRRFTVTEPDALAGLPPDFVAAHQPDASGAVTLTTEGPDVQPIIMYAASDAVRRRMLVEWQNVAYPENIAVLQQMLRTRAAIAHTLGYADWASYELSTRMARTPADAQAFVDRVVAASRQAVERDVQRLLARKRQDHPAATGITAWERRYYTELVRQSQYSFDSQSVRPYFAYDRVRDGVLAVAQQLFGFEFRRAALPVWHSSVESYEVLEKGRVVGRIYLDMHTRPGKGGTGASSGAGRNGVAGRQVPEIVLLGRFPGGSGSDPGLMTFDQVVSFFHEFGHLVHAVASGSQRWMGLARVAELDFNESPAIVLEEWAADPATLGTFARHYQTNQPIPAALVQQMRRASELGRGYDVRQQMVFAELSLALHRDDPERIDPVAMHRDLTNKYLPTPYVDGTHFPASFTHLSNPNYASAYYGYMWSQVIAKDLFAEFDRNSLLSPAIARKFRRTILDQGGARPAAHLVGDFLGRPFTFGAFEAWINQDTPPPQ